MLLVAVFVISCGDEVAGSNTVARSSEKAITSFEVAGERATVANGGINEGAKTISVGVPHGTGVSALSPTIAISAKASISPASGWLQDFTSPVSYTVSAEDGTSEIYTVTITIPQYLKLASDGSTLAIQDATWSATSTEDAGSTWSCALDSNGLIWEIKTDDGGARDKDLQYRWGGKTAISGGGGTYYNDWDPLVDAANSENSGAGLCGYTDWRVPTIQELRTIVEGNEDDTDPDTNAPFINKNIFPHTVNANYWSASQLTVGYPSIAWNVNFASGYSIYIHNRVNIYSVRLVRGGE